MRCPRCQQENSTGQNFCGACGTPIGSSDAPGLALSYTDLHHALREALEQRTATADILRVISSSPTNVQPVFDAIVRSAVKLCNGLFSSAFQFDGELLHVAALHNVSDDGLEAFHRLYPVPPSREFPVGRAILDRALIHIPDAVLDPENKHLERSPARSAGGALWSCQCSERAFR